MLSLVADDSTAHATRAGYAYRAEPDLEAHLEHARLDPRRRPWLYESLLAGRVHVVDYEILLGHDGPLYELRPRTEGDERSLAVYTSRARIPTHLDPADAEPMPFADVLGSLDEGVGLVLNPEGPRPHRISAAETALLRRVIQAA